MCGIAGLAFGSIPVDAGELRRFTDALTHRGPDGSGIWFEGNVGLGHRRLAILDLSDAGQCPMRIDAPNGRSLWVTYNGEVFNFLELRTELEALGYSFRGDSDTEVVGAALLQWGTDALNRFNGMWALAAWNPIDRQLLLARDRFGVKPLYYHMGVRLAFASELKAFLSLNNFAATLNSGLFELTVKDAGPWEGATHETMLAGVSQLPGGHLIRLDADGRGGVERWWNPDAHAVTVPARYDDQVVQFRELFLDAVRVRLRSDVPVGTCLSGGLDSSAVAGAVAWLHGANSSKSHMKRSAADWQHTFVATYPGSALDEQRHADVVAEAIGARAHHVPFHHAAATALAESAIWSAESPHGLVSTPVWLLYREIYRSGVRVTLDGHGGDELLGGYTPHLRVPREQLNAHLKNQLQRDVLPGILRNFDRASMGNGVESRMPLLDWRLVTYAWSLPPESKIGGGFTKRILRDAMEGLVPDSIRWRRSKVGFNAPLVEWANASLNGLLLAVAELPFWQETNAWDGPRVARELRTRIAAGPWQYSDWQTLARYATLASLTLWHRAFIEGSRTPLLETQVTRVAA